MGWPHTNGIESFWSMLKRAHKGVYHKISAKHPERDAWRAYLKCIDTPGQVGPGYLCIRPD